MKVWVVMDGDDEGNWIVAVYASQTLAVAHAARKVSFRASEHEVLTTLAEPSERLL